jgi:hypothetical protein
MKTQPKLTLLSVLKTAADIQDETRRMIQPQIPQLYMTVMPRGISPIQTALQSSGIRLDMRRVL